MVMASRYVVFPEPFSPMGKVSREPGLSSAACFARKFSRETRLRLMAEGGFAGSVAARRSLCKEEHSRICGVRYPPCLADSPPLREKREINHEALGISIHRSWPWTGCVLSSLRQMFRVLSIISDFCLLLKFMNMRHPLTDCLA